MDTDALRKELVTLNAEVEAVIAKRRAWMDSHMDDFAKYHVGYEIYNMDTGARLGTISRLYRYWQNRDPRYDTSMSIEYEFHTGNNCYDNTSRYAGCLSIGTADELAKRMRSDAEYLALGKTDEERWAKVFEDMAKTP